MLTHATTHSPTVGNNLKKSVYISNFLLILLVFSCGQNSSEKELNGNWREIENEYSTWHFYPDSLVLKIPSYPNGIYDRTEWSANKSQIEFELREFGIDSLGNKVDTINKVLINYNLSDKKDSLFGTLKNNYGEYKFSLLKTENYIEYLKRKFGIEFTLPKNDSIELKRIDPVYGMKIFMNFKNDNIIAKTELSNSLNNLETDIKEFKKQLESYFGTYDLRTERFYLSVYADKKIPDSIITANLAVTVKSNFFLNNKYDAIPIPRPPGDTLPIKIFRIYESEQKQNIGLRKAKEIKTIANTVYN
ncbi:hypothetical protein [Winogradskyella marincola]|uniref:Lipoprotein n=1 Tax=Winogradskyella marincola TaxID=3037795 RepID=A0ABT6G174_9FLAO|nr:hypothetical protein [Winogradskyella sp. YYF002]MDG4715792.1 hypothetical protein [Winogradskyella sp. YYF002]